MENNNIETLVADDQLNTAVAMLKTLVDNPGQLFLLSEQQRIELLTLAGKLSHPDKKEMRERKKAKSKVTFVLLLTL